MKQINILNSFDKVLTQLKQNTGYYDILNINLDVIRKELDVLSNIFGITSRQTILLATIIDMCKYGSIGIDKLAESLNCNFFSFLQFKKDIDILKAKELLDGNRNLSISKELMDSLENNSPYKQSLVSDLTTSRMMEKLSKMISCVSEKQKVPSSLLKLMDRMILSNPSTSLAMACDRYSVLSYSSLPIEFIDEESFLNVYRNDSYTDAVSPAERLLFYVLLSFSDNKIKWDDLSSFFMPYDLKQLQRNYNNGILDLQHLGVLRFGGDEDYVQIYPEVKNQAYADIIIEQNKEKSYPNIVKSSNIRQHNLFFPEDTERQISSINNLLSKERFVNVRNSLIQQGLRTGFAALFYGGPGTGKTEGVYQLAKSTDRDIITVNVSQLKSEYVGESEKNVKKVFEDYKEYVLDYGTFPILLFNEADSILGIRNVGALYAADKMENSIQNIILQEMEIFDGIMVATTNLVNNLDSAFERRFLFKVRFTQPDNSTRSKIWRSLIPELSQSDADSLAVDFNLSGGQIENICRKKVIQSIITDGKITLSMIRRWCKEELLSKVITIGFSVQ